MPGGRSRVVGRDARAELRRGVSGEAVRQRSEALRVVAPPGPPYEVSGVSAGGCAPDARLKPPLSMTVATPVPWPPITW